MKVLVVYGSERGGTAGLAHMVGAAFRRQGWAVEVRDAASPGQIHADVVVLGGALYLNRWHKAARKFARDHRATLQVMPVWLFSSGPLDDSARPGDVAPVAQVRDIAADLEARGHMTFGGRLEPDAKGLVARRMARKMAGDWRDERQVDEWVAEILRELMLEQIDLTERRMVVIPEQREPSDKPARA